MKWVHSSFLLLSLTLGGTSLAPAAEIRQPITHEILWSMKRVGPPVPSPDGQWVVFSLTEPAYSPAEQVSDIWIVPADGSAGPRRLTFSKGGESGLAWSPDSRKLAFSAKREGDEVAQIYILDLAAGGEAVRFTALSTAARSPQFSPDGSMLLFVSSVFPGAPDDDANRKIAAERKARKYSARVYDGFPIRNWDHWLDDSQAHVFVQSLESGSKARDLLAGSKLVQERGFAGRSTSGGQELDPAWAPDGKSIVFVATTQRHTAAHAEVDLHLYRVLLSGGEPQKISSGSGSFTGPVFAPDGSRLYCSFTPSTAKVYNLERIAAFSWPDPGGPRVLTAAFGRSVSSFAPTPDGKAIYLLAEDAGHEKLYTLAAEGGPVRPAFEHTRGSYTGLAIPTRAPGTVILANWESAVHPPEVVRLEASGVGHKALTSFNTERAAQVDWLPLRHFTFTSSRGKQIHSMIALPPAFDEGKKYPLLVLMHGGPHSMWRDQFVLRWNYHLLAAPGYVVLLTNFTGSTGYGEKFAQDIQGDPLQGPGDEINEAADEAIRRFPFIDGSRQAAAGASYGGHLANWMQATTTRYKCLISHAGLINLESQWGTSDIIYHREVNNGGPVWEQGPVWREQNPIRLAKNFKTPMLLTIGENDFRVPLNQTLENWSVLQRLQVPSRLIVFPDENHWILKGENSRFFYQEVHAWLSRHLRSAD